MPVIPYIESIAAIAEQSKTSEDLSFGLRDFLDGFYKRPEAAKLQSEPRPLRENFRDGGYADAYLAATAEYLAQQFLLPIPTWTKARQRYLDDPVFAFKTPEGRMFLLVDSPTAFRVRNIFISADALSRA